MGSTRRGLNWKYPFVIGLSDDPFVSVLPMLAERKKNVLDASAHREDSSLHIWILIFNRINEQGGGNQKETHDKTVPTLLPGTD